MRTFAIWWFSSSLVLGSVACGDDEAPREPAAPAASAPLPAIEQIRPPLDLEKPPSDATTTTSGLIYKKLGANTAGAQATPGAATLVHYTGWSQRTGHTFFSTRARGQPITIDVAHVAPGFAEALRLLREGEKAMVWVPSSPGTSDVLVYEIEVVDVVTPPSVANRSATEHRTAAGPGPRDGHEPTEPRTR